MTVVWWVLLGFGLGIVWTLAAIYLFLTSDKILVVDRWWMESPSNWEWLRQYELDERAEGTGGDRDA